MQLIDLQLVAFFVSVLAIPGAHLILGLGICRAKKWPKRGGPDAPGKQRKTNLTKPLDGVIRTPPFYGLVIGEGNVYFMPDTNLY